MLTQHTITNRDVDLLLAIADPARRREADGPIPLSVLADLAELVGCDAVGYVEHDPYRETGREYGYLESSDAADDPDPDSERLAQLSKWFWRNYWVWGCSEPERTGNHALVARECDHVLTPAAADAWAEYARMADCEHDMLVSLPARGQYSCRVLLWRQNPDFTEREQRLMQLIQPHLAEIQAAHLCDQETPAAVLTARQQVVLRLVRAGLTNRQVARRLQIAEGTVRKHLEHIYTALDVTNRVEAVTRDAI